MDCEQVKELSIANILGELEPKSWEGLALEFHLQSCRACAEQYENNKQTIGFIKTHKTEFAEAFESLEAKEAGQLQIERSRQSIEAKLGRIEAREKRAGYRGIIWRLTAAAACLTIGAFACLLVLDSGPRKGLNPNLQVSDPIQYVRIEMPTDGGGIIVPAGELINSGYELKTLVINDKHRLVMNVDTALSVRPLRAGELTGCIVNLTSGQVYANVESDGNPFVVKTAYGRAVITGTIFDIEATDTITKLIVAEGTVQFSSRAGSVEVTAGNQSAIFANSAPSVPQLCDAAELTAWTKAPEPEPVLAKVDSVERDVRLEELGLNFIPVPADLERINYDTWVEDNREWFESELPQFFKLQDALTKENIEVDYPELLILSGDLRWFVYPPSSPRRFLIPDLDSLLKAADHYGFDEKWLTSNISGSKFFSKPGILTNQTAFKEWIDCFERLVQSQKEADGGLLLNSLHAAVYLENTRTLTWLCIAEGIAELPEKDKPEVLELLQTEVNAAAELKGGIINLLRTSIDRPCDMDDYVKLLETVLENINTIKEIEERIPKDEARR